MQGKIKICGTEYDIKSSVLTMERFTTLFGEDFGDVLGRTNQKLLSIRNEYNDEEQLGNAITHLSNVIIDGTKLAYAMIKEAEPSFKSYEEWLGELDGIMQDMSWLGEVIKAGFRIIRGGI